MAMRLRRRAYITLVELLVVIFLVILIAGVVGLKIQETRHEQRFRSEVSLVVNQLRLAQDLMLILDADLYVTFKGDPKKGLKCCLESEKELPRTWQRELKQCDYTLKAIHSIDIRPHQDPKIAFLAGGTKMTEGVLVLSDKSNPHDPKAMNQYITLIGYPQPIVSSNTPSKLDEKYRAEDQISQLTNTTIQEIEARK
jgi:hypothetical protein